MTYGIRPTQYISATNGEASKKPKREYLSF
jgi:hypothetical protein